MKKELQNREEAMLSDIRSIINPTKEKVSKVITSNIAMMYWEIGCRVNSEILDNQRAEYAKQIVATMWRQLSWSHFKIVIPNTD